MRKIWVVIRREFVEKVRTKWFIISTVLGPVMMAATIVVPMRMAEGAARERDIRIIDASASAIGRQVEEMLGGPLPVHAEWIGVTVPEMEHVADSLTALVGQKELDGYLILTDATASEGEAEYRGSNVSSQADMEVLEQVVTEAVLSARLGQQGVDRAVVAWAQIPVRMRAVSIRGGEVTDSSGRAAFVLAYVVWMLLYLTILLYGVQVMGAVVEEKTSRVIEVLVSSLRPFQLLAGKVIGVGAVGLFQMSIWGLSAWWLYHERAFVLELFGVPNVGSGEGFVFPEVALDTVAIVLAYFLLGYFLYAAMFAAVAATSNSEAEARQAQLPVVMLLIVPTLLMVGILQEPDGMMAVTLSLIPFCAPIAMPVRWAAVRVPAGEVAASLALLAMMLVLVVWVAARIYRVGILMHGKRPSLADLLRWIRA